MDLYGKVWALFLNGWFYLFFTQASSLVPGVCLAIPRREVGLWKEMGVGFFPSMNVQKKLAL